MRLVVAILSLAGLIVFAMVVVLLTSLEATFYIVTSIVIVVISIFFAVIYRYQMPKADQAIVRTGGQRYIVRFQGGGVWINTIFHEVRPISLNTMRLEITRVGKEESLITSDFMRADVTAVFYVKVPPEEESVIKAAQTLGQKTIPVAQLRGLFSIGRRKTVKPGQRDVEQDVMLENIKNLLADKVDGALRSVAATMELEDLQKERQEFAEQVKQIVTPDLKENGLFLETVTITMLNQTPVTEMDPNNRFDAVGIKDITGIIKAAAVEKEKKVKEADVAITGIDVKAAKQKFTLEQDRSWAEADMQMKIATYSAEKEAETIKIVYEQEVVGQRAGIIKDQELQKVEINKTKEVEIAKAEQEQKVNERIIEKNLIIEIKNIEMGQKVAEREILRNLEVGLKNIDQEQKIGIKDFEKQLAIAKAKIAQEEGVGVREIEKMLAIAVNRVAQEQKVLEREIEKNKFVEIAAIEMSQKVAEKEIERNLIIQKVGYQAQVGIKEAEVNSLKAQYVLEKDRVFAEADKEKAIQAYSATRKAEGAKIQYEQEVISEVAKIAKDQTISVRDIEKSKNVEIAGIEKT
ncbi:MAG: Flotillin family protein, partial [Candidatus Poribacteria bacterium]|nr:Flotillin family protein [Candidatus Poribacteria bacterium]